MNDIHDYSSIYDLEHPEPRYHKRMSRQNRAAQFAPFSALVGYQEALDEEKREVDEKVILCSEEVEKISNALNVIKTDLKRHPLIEITYYLKDDKKNGGKYLTKKEWVKNLDEISKVLLLKDDSEIKFDDILDIKIL